MAASPGAAFADGDALNDCGCVAGLLLQRPCMKVANSSWSNCFSVSRGPCSRTTTENPAVDSSFAMMPPAAPEPMMAKSTVSAGAKRARARDCSMSPSPVRFDIVGAERRLESRLMFEADHVPAGIVAIAAPGWQRKRANDGVEPDRLEERRLLDGTDDFVLLDGGEFRERRRFEHVGSPPVQILKPLG